MWYISLTTIRNIDDALKIVLPILLHCCYLNIIPVKEGFQENDCYGSAEPHFRPTNIGAANYAVVERKDQNNASDVKQDSQETALYSIVNKKSSGKYTNSKAFFLFWRSKNVIVN